jgi:lysozyme family protein
MKTSKEQIYKWIFTDEGPYSNDPGDNGGMTTWGITANEVCLWRKVKRVSEADMRTFTQSEAREILDAWYWGPLHCDELPVGVDYIVMDAGLLHGIDRAARWLQIVTGVSIDGRVGPKTLLAAQKFKAVETVARITELRRRRAKAHPDAKHFLKGWTNRITRCHLRCNKLMGVE